MCFVGLSLTACNLLKPAGESSAPIILPEVVIEPEVKVYKPSETKVHNLLHTKLELVPVWEKQELNGTATLTLKPYFYTQDSLVLDAKGMDIKKVMCDHSHSIGNGETVGVLHEITDFTNTGEKLHIPLGESFSRKDSIKITITYTAKTYEREAGGSNAIAGDRGLYFVNHDGSTDQPQQIWTQGETESNSCWFPTIDKPNERHSQELFITVDDKFATLSNGELVYSNFNAGGTRTDYWKQDLGHAPYLTMMAIGEFTVLKDAWKRPNGELMLVDYYMEPEFAEYANDIFGNTKEMLSYYSELLDYPYPWDKYSQVIVREYVSGAMENTSAVIHGDFLNQTREELIDGDNEAVIAHELFHHWFGDLVTCESWGQLPLNESFATYGEYLWDEYKYGDDDALMNHNSSRGAYMQESSFSKKNMIRYTYEDKEDMFDSHSYAKGGQILHMLRYTVGDEAFFASLALYLKQHQYTAAEIHDLRIAFEEITGEDLNWFFNQWFLSKGHPVIEITYPVDSISGAQSIVLKQTQDFTEEPIFTFPVEVEMHYTDGSKETRDLWIDKSFVTLDLPAGKRIKTFDFDTADYLLCVEMNKIDREAWTDMWTIADNYIEKSKAIRKTAELDLEGKPEVLLSAMSDKFWAIREQAVEFVDSSFVANAAVIQKLQSLAETDEKSLVRAAALGSLMKLGKDQVPARLVEIAQEDPSPAVRSNALLALYQSDNAKGLARADELAADAEGDLLYTIAYIYSEDGGEQYQAFFQKALEINGFGLFQIMGNYQVYAGKQKPGGMQTAILEAEKVVKNASAWWQRYAAYEALFEWDDLLQDRMSDEEAGLIWQSAKTELDRVIVMAKSLETEPRMQGYLMAK